jgi:hypothetical protein
LARREALLGTAGHVRPLDLEEVVDEPNADHASWIAGDGVEELATRVGVATEAVAAAPLEVVEHRGAIGEERARPSRRVDRWLCWRRAWP